MVFEACDRTKVGDVLFHCGLLQGRYVIDLQRDDFKSISNGGSIKPNQTYLIFIISDHCEVFKSSLDDDSFSQFGAIKEIMEHAYAKYIPILRKITADLSISSTKCGTSLCLMIPTSNKYYSSSMEQQKAVQEIQNELKCFFGRIYEEIEYESENNIRVNVHTS